ncbi:MAG: gamma-glutamyltransferase [Deltaproteobacteria bacterium]|nr:gamma-glutamyltransferase [Deltaproteobacteria bacterium]
MKRRVSIVLWCVSAFLMTGLVSQSPPAESKNAAVFTHDAVAADHAEASKAGAEILAAGGNAADAAAATMLALGVVNPASRAWGAADSLSTTAPRTAH